MVVSGSLNRWEVAYNHPIGKDYKWYISGIVLANWMITCYRSHLLREPGNSIDNNPLLRPYLLGTSRVGEGLPLKNHTLCEWCHSKCHIRRWVFLCVDAEKNSRRWVVVEPTHVKNMI